MEKEILFKAGLGLKKIKLDTLDDEQAVVNKITSDEKDNAGNAPGFPQLKACGGFELMRCQPNCRDLSVIDCSWYAKDLRSNLGGGQGKIYLQPIQKSLSTTPIVGESQCKVTEKCHMCNQEILVHKLRDHLWSCTVGLESGDSDNENTDLVDPLPSAATSASNVSIIPIIHSSSPPPVAPPTPQQTTQQSINFLVVGVSDDALPNVIITSSASPSCNAGNISNASSSITPPSSLVVVDLTNTPAAPNNNEHSVDGIVDDTVTYCQQNNTSNPLEILWYFQSKIVVVRAIGGSILG